MIIIITVSERHVRSLSSRVIWLPDTLSVPVLVLAFLFALSYTNSSKKHQMSVENSLPPFECLPSCYSSTVIRNDRCSTGKEGRKERKK